MPLLFDEKLNYLNAYFEDLLMEKNDLDDKIRFYNAEILKQKVNFETEMIDIEKKAVNEAKHYY